MKYYRKLDGLRFIAITLVFLEHYAHFIGSRISAGYYGVDLFFVLSGFLITEILLNAPQKSYLQNFANFIGRRTLRIFPIYYLTIAILLIFNQNSIRDNVWYLVTYTFNYASIINNLPITPLSHFWSLAVEEQFYIFWPTLVLFLRKYPAFLLITTSFIVLFGYSQLTFNYLEWHNKYNNISILTRMSSLGLGALGAMLNKYYLLPRRLFVNKLIENLSIPILILALISPNFFAKPVLLGILSLYFVIKSSIFEFNSTILRNFLSNRIIVHIGTLAYGLYVYHFPIGIYLTQYLFDPIWLNIDFNKLGVLGFLKWHSWFIKFILFSLISYFVALLSYNYIEKPILNLKNKFFKY